MGNKKVLSKATRELNKTKRFATPKNIIEDPRGQWAHPGEITRIPSDRITMQGVPYPVMAYPNMGEPQMMYPGGEYYFPGADYVDEYPELKKGGTPKSLVKMPKPSKKGLASKKFSRSLEATNRLFTENPLFAKPKSKKRKVFDPNAQYQDGGVISQEEVDAANNAMMKARLAYAQMHGNPAAQRMIVAPDQPYQFDNGMTGTHYMASMDDYAVPQIQDVDGQLMLGDFGPESSEAIRLDNPEDAMYFAEHYKDVSPAFVEAELTPEEIEEYRKGGFIVEELDTYPRGGGPGKGKKGKPKKVEPFVTSDPKEYELRNKAFNDSLRLYQAYQMQDKLMGPGSYEIQEYTPYKWNTQQLKAGRKKTYDKFLKGYYANDYQSEKDQFKKGYNDWTARKQDQQLIKYYKSLGFTDKDIMYHSSPDIVSDKIKAVGTYHDGTAASPIYEKPVQKVIFQPKPIVDNLPPGISKSQLEKAGVIIGDKAIVGYEEVQQLDPTTGTTTTVINPVYKDLEQPIPTLHPTKVNQELKKFVYPENLSDEETELDSMDAYTESDVESGIPGPGGHWEDKSSRYIDWDGNSIAFNGIRFRKPGHGGDLIRKGKRHYIHYPSIEKRYDAWIEPDELPEEEYQEGGQYVELELRPEEIQEYARGGFIIEDISVPTLNQKQEGGEPKRKKTRFQKGTYDPNETAGYILDEQEVVVPAKASNWGKAAIAYEKRNPEEEFINKKKKQYLKKNKGLNELYGINMENFPEDVEQNFRNEYDYNKNTAVVKKVGKQEGWNPNRRTEYVDNLNDTQRGIVAESKYGSKLQPGYWNRSLAGVQELGNTLLPGQPFQFNIPGLTKKEQKEMRDSKLSALETLAPIDIPGAAIANFVKNRGLSTGSDYKKLPGLLSGEKMANVTDVEAMALNPFTYAGLEAIPELGVNIVKGAKALPGAISASRESGLLSNAYKANPFANKLNKYNRVVGEDAVLDLQNSGLVRAGDYGGVESNFGSFDGIRTTPYPSFGTGAPRQAYIDQTIQQGKSPFIISTDRTMKASNLGRHGKGSTMFPIDETGKYMSAFSADDVKVFDVKPHWLKGYKEVPKELPGSPNQTAGFAKSITGNEAVQARSPFQQVIDQISTTVSEVPKNIKYKINNYQNIKKAPDLVKDEIAKMLTPEGKARLKDLGVDDTDDFIKFMDRSKLFTKRGLTSHAGMTVGDNNVMSPFMNLDFEQLENLYDLSKLKHKDDLVRAVISHEIGHNIQGYLSSIGKATNRGVSNLDKETILKLKPFIDKNADAKTVKYFFEGSDKSEPLAHLRELKQNMLFKGVIDNIHQNITAEDLGNFYINKGGYSDRIMHSIKPGEEAYKKLARLLNKTPVLAPVAIGAGATLLPQEKSGGIVMELSDAAIKAYKKGGWIIEEM